MELGIGFGIGSAFAFGGGDFTGGSVARRFPAVAVAAGAQLAGLVALLALLLLIGEAPRDAGALWIGALAGVAGAIGLVALYRGLAMGSMGIVTALSGVGSVIIPLGVSVLLGASVSPLQLLGMGLAAGAAAAASGATIGGTVRPEALGMAAAAAIGFGCWFTLLDLAAEGDALWALVGSRVGASIFMAVLVVVTRTRASFRRASLGLIALAGLLDVVGNALFVLARGEIPVGLAAAISGIYPLVTMLLARYIGGESLPRLGLLGVLLAVGGIVLISIG